MNLTVENSFLNCPKINQTAEHIWAKFTLITVKEERKLRPILHILIDLSKLMFSFISHQQDLPKGFAVCFRKGMQTALFTCHLDYAQEKEGEGMYTCPRTYSKKQ